MSIAEVKAPAKNSTEQEWIRKIIELLSLNERSVIDRLFRRGAKYEYLPVFGGILLHMNGQGVVWLPKSHTKGLLSKAGIGSAVIHKLGLIFSFTIPGGGFLGVTYDFFRDRVWKEPPTEPQQYLPRMINRVEYGSFTLNPGKIKVIVRPLRSIVKRVKKQEKAEEENPFRIHFLRFIDKIATAKEGEKRTTLKAFTNRVVKKFQRTPTFKCRDEQRLLEFVEGLEKDGFEVTEAP